FHGRPYAFAALGKCKASGVADEHDRIAHDFALAIPEEKVSMPCEFPGKTKCHLARGAQEINEMDNVLGKGVLVKPTQPDVEEISFAKTPAVALKIPAEVKLGYFRLNSAKTCLVRRHLKFNFLRDHRFI